MKTNKEKAAALRLIAETIEVGCRRYPDGGFDIGESTVRFAADICPAGHDRACGTVHCVAGWFLVGALLPEGKVTSPYLRVIIEEKPEAGLEYGDGSRVIDEIFGECIRTWAVNHPDIWGNTCGYSLFVAMSSYDIEPGVSELEGIIQHFRNVADRLEKVKTDG